MTPAERGSGAYGRVAVGAPMYKLVLIFLGSGAGGVCRYKVDGWVQRLVGAAFPVGTLLINVTGCFLIGFLTAAFAGRVLVREEHRVGLLVGVLGGFTTFSTFGLETFTFLNDRQYARAGLNVALSVLVGLAAVAFGYRLAQKWLGV
jgi:CrcB protein